jgi:predicted membrane-bound spermidine synthase
MKTSQLIQDNDLTIPNQAWGIFLISILGLFLETLFIRWIGTEIRIFAYLQNTTLVACFLGLGLGMFTSTKPVDIKQSLVPLTILLVLMVFPSTRTVLGHISDFLSTRGDFLIWGPLEASDKTQQFIYLAAGLALTYGVLILIVDIFVPLGRILGRLMNINQNPIWAYSVNILGSIFGTWAFVLFSYLYQPPFVWFLIAAALFACFIIWSNRGRRISFVLLGLIVVLSWFVSQVPGALEVIWSPYQKLEAWKSEPNWLGDFQIHVNNSGYQVITDLGEAHVSSKPGKFSPQLNGISQYDIPLLLHPNPKSVLLVGAGAGNDAAGALRHNAQFVTAVEIDPAIISLGKEFHPEHPYLSPKVKVVNDDARSFFATTTERYDVISFGLLDSHTTTSMTNARLDHYVYTRESLIQAKSSLKKGGILTLTFEVQKPFIADRILVALEEIFNQPPIIFRIPYSSYGFGGVMFVTGDLRSVQEQLDQNPSLSSYIQELQKTDPIDLPRSTKVITDDWPYLYLESAKIPVLYYLLFGLMIAVFIRSNKKWESKLGISYLNRSFWHFFFLGAAFLLLEVQNISKASVVLGNTWQVNAVIISSILTMALLANWIASKFPHLTPTLVYFLLVGSCLSLYFIDLARFGFLQYPIKATIVGALTSLPMFFSGIVFIHSFAVAQDKSNALGANLIGALVGALLQSITFIIGIKALLLVVAGFYLLSLLTVPIQSETKERLIPELAK